MKLLAGTHGVDVNGKTVSLFSVAGPAFLKSSVAEYVVKHRSLKVMGSARRFFFPRSAS